MTIEDLWELCRYVQTEIVEEKGGTNMGYCVSQGHTEIFISAEAVPEVFAAIKRLATLGKKYSWVDNTSVFDAANIEDALVEWGWEVDFDDAGNIVRLDWIWEKAIDEDVLFPALAPWVRDGSFITMIGEDGYQWRWAFLDGIATRLEGVVVFK